MHVGLALALAVFESSAFLQRVDLVARPLAVEDVDRVQAPDGDPVVFRSAEVGDTPAYYQVTLREACLSIMSSSMRLGWEIRRPCSRMRARCSICRQPTLRRRERAALGRIASCASRERRCADIWSSCRGFLRRARLATCALRLIPTAVGSASVLRMALCGPRPR